MFTQSIGLGLYFVQGNASWRVLFGLQDVPIAALLGFSYWMPESPRWLCLKGRYTDALDTLRLLHGGQRDSEHDEHSSYYKEFAQIQAQVEEEKTYTSSLRRVVHKRTYLRRFALICAFFFFQQSVSLSDLRHLKH